MECWCTAMHKSIDLNFGNSVHAHVIINIGIYILCTFVHIHFWLRWRSAPVFMGVWEPTWPTTNRPWMLQIGGPCHACIRYYLAGHANACLSRLYVNWWGAILPHSVATPRVKTKRCDAAHWRWSYILLCTLPTDVSNNRAKHKLARACLFPCVWTYA
jgi:hypothetical protein